MIITINLPVSKHLKEFLTTKFGKEYHLGTDNWFGVLISTLLERKSCWDFKPKKEEQNTEFYSIHIKLSYANKHGIFLTKGHEELLRKSIESLFRENIYEQALLNKECYGIDYKTTILNCLEYYGITDDNSNYLQALMRDFSRKKDRIETRRGE
ncbi:hypothetical protein AB4865_07265 [Capnocytophaga sp. ARDL2]|uniref:hypothetical protein n=1 Tax=Capnocytophaga sp. ARDL2 TaxID=3238809 RepID=UPI00355924D5